MNPVCSIFFHNYYGEHKTWMDYFVKNISFDASLYYNMVEDSMYNIEAAEKNLLFQYQPGTDTKLQQVIVRQSPNKGKDIGGKLVLLDAYQKLGMPTAYGLLLHDKRSPYKANNTTWTENLFKIVNPEFSKKALQVFEKNPGVGIITAAGNTADEFDQKSNSFISNNKNLLPVLQSSFSINPASFCYVTGTMFWFRMEPVHLFFKKNPPLKIRAMLEQGNITDDYTGSYTHSWERLLCWIITGQNYTIKTI